MGRRTGFGEQMLFVAREYPVCIEQGRWKPGFGARIANEVEIVKNMELNQT